MLEEQKVEEAKRYDFWAILGVRYSFWALVPRVEFYRLAPSDPTYAKMVLPALEHRGEIAAEDSLDKPLNDLESHMTTQLMKTVATLSASNTKNRGQGNRGGTADKG